MSTPPWHEADYITAALLEASIQADIAILARVTALFSRESLLTFPDCGLKMDFAPPEQATRVPQGPPSGIALPRRPNRNSTHSAAVDDARQASDREVIYGLWIAGSVALAVPPTRRRHALFWSGCFGGKRKYSTLHFSLECCGD